MMRKTTHIVKSLVWLALTSILVSGQDVPRIELKKTEIVDPVKVFGSAFDRRLTFVFTNSTSKSVFLLGRKVAGGFDPSGHDWWYNPSTQKVEYFDDKKSIWTNGWLVYPSRKEIKPGESFVFQTIEGFASSCYLAKQVVRYQSVSSKKVKKVETDWYPASTGPCQRTAPETPPE